ncbi:unnamed protein product [[Actinomadura] parvosata subsp. kistnae]|nr:unnamed protein product [Actinomadura parvosata subsp. kistnae]
MIPRRAAAPSPTAARRAMRASRVVARATARSCDASRMRRDAVL